MNEQWSWESQVPERMYATDIRREGDDIDQPVKVLHLCHPHTPCFNLPVYTDVRLPEGRTWVRRLDDERTPEEMVAMILHEEESEQEPNAVLQTARTLSEEEVTKIQDELQASAHDNVIELVRNRGSRSLSRYGMNLHAFNSRDTLKDVLRELVDASLYTQQLIEEEGLRKKAVEATLRSELLALPELDGVSVTRVQEIVDKAILAAFDGILD